MHVEGSASILALIELNHLTKTFKGKTQTVDALKDINLHIEQGDIFGIIGMSGAGKSTLVRCINFLEQPTSGSVVIDGPLSLDVALYKEAAEIKKVKGSSVAGDADCLLFPNIESGNVFFKASTHMGGGEIAAMVMGTKVPCVLTSRGDSSLTKLYSIALACLAAK